MLRPRSLFARIFLGYLLLVVGLSLGFGFLFLPDLRRSAEGEILSAMRVEAERIAALARPALVDDHGPAHRALEALLAARAREAESVLRVFDASGRPLGSESGELPGLPPDATVVRRPVRHEGRVVGEVWVARSRDGLDRAYRQARKRLFATTLAGVGLALGLGLLLARTLTGPLREVASAASSLRQGRYDLRVRVRSDDEVGAVAAAFNEMAAALQQQIRTLESDRERIASVLRSMREGVVAVDADERILHVNPAACELLEIDSASALGRPYWEVVRVSEIATLLRDTLARGGAWVREARLRDDRVFELRASVHRGGAGGPPGAVLVLHDLTELRRLEGVRRDFVANVSHELKTPLAAAAGLVDSMVDDPSMADSTRRRFLQRARAQLDRLEGLVHDLLVLARIEEPSRREREGAARRAEVGRVLRAVVDEHLPLADRRSQTIDLALPETDCEVCAGEEDLRQIFANLLSNAIHYTPEGGRIAVRAQCRRRSAIVEFEDDGVGIERRHLDRIFERFYRIDAARSRKQGGTGLGLAIVKHTLENLGGRIDVRSHPGEGSCFEVEIPRGEDPAGDTR